MEAAVDPERKTSDIQLTGVSWKARKLGVLSTVVASRGEVAEPDYVI